jgi:hypothetical protein
LKHWGDSTACCYHTDSFVLLLHELLRLQVSNHEILVFKIRNIAADACDLQAALARFHLVNELSKDATLMLEVP